MISRHDRKCDVYLCENLIMNNGKRIELSFSLSWCYHRNYHQLGHYGPHWKKNPQKHLLPLVRRMMMMIMMMIIMMMIMMMMMMALTSSCASTLRGRSQEAWALEVASPDSTLIYILIYPDSTLLYPVSLLFGRLTSHLTTTIIITTTIVIIIVVITIVIDDEDEEDDDDDDDVDGQTLPHLRLGVEQLENGSHSSLRNIFDMANIWEIFSKE